MKIPGIPFDDVPDIFVITVVKELNLNSIWKSLKKNIMRRMILETQDIDSGILFEFPRQDSFEEYFDIKLCFSWLWVYV